jgi:hypothetical protein
LLIIQILRKEVESITLQVLIKYLFGVFRIDFLVPPHWGETGICPALRLGIGPQGQGEKMIAADPYKGPASTGKNG